MESGKGPDGLIRRDVGYRLHGDRVDLLKPAHTHKHTCSYL